VEPSPGMSAPVAAIVMAAGQGTRMKSGKAKVLHAVCEEPMVSYPVRLAQALGARPVVLVVGHQAEAVEAEVRRRFPAGVAFALQAEQKGTGHAVMMGLDALPDFEGRIFILSGDVPLLTQGTLERLAASAGPADPLALVSFLLDDPTGYGRLLRGADGRLTRIVEHKDATPEQRAVKEVNAGIYWVDAAFLRRALARLGNDNAQGEYYLTDIVGLALADGHTVQSVLADPQEVAGANDRAQLADLDRAMRRRVNAALMATGVTLVDPDRTYIGSQVQIGRDTVVEPNVYLRGQTVIGAHCVVDTGCVLQDATVGDGVHLKPYTVIEEATVHAEAIIGPFSRLRPKAEIMAQAHVGNFVELKNARLGPGAKANHLAYIGDATVGAKANVGAGTITCNYDGYGKYQTNIGAGVFVGSNATLVAPLTIGDNAYVAAGSTITDEVMPDDVAFGRARQIVKSGRATTLREKAKAQAEAAKKAKDKVG
jgi:bifunctional UDP-N-acetylglucosamine pyrophosphorylase/glucosamine-1-phosphate N-acetyltransferase